MMARPNAHISRAAHLVRTTEENWNEKAAGELLELQKTQWGDNVIAENPLLCQRILAYNGKLIN